MSEWPFKRMKLSLLQPERILCHIICLDFKINYAVKISFILIAFGQVAVYPKSYKRAYLWAVLCIMQYSCLFFLNYNYYSMITN